MAEDDDSVLRALGWDAEWQAAADASQRDDGAVGRVARIDMGRATVVCESGTVSVAHGDEPAATGDWVLVAGDQIVAVLPRRSAFTRGASIDGVARD
jgi:hypothetical protein